MLGRVDPMAALVEQGMLLASARGPLPNVAEMVAGEPIRGSWWSHPASHAIFNALNSLADSPDVVRLRLVNGKVTLVHRRLWPALVRVADRLPAGRLAAIQEEHTRTGAHRVREGAFSRLGPERRATSRPGPRSRRCRRRPSGVPRTRLARSDIRMCCVDGPIRDRLHTKLPIRRPSGDRSRRQIAWLRR